MKEVSLGLDSGNGTIKIVLNDNKEVVDYVYLKNNGVVDTIKEGIKILCKRNPDVKVTACGVTGAGRKFASRVVGSDICKTEIICHTIGTQNFISDVKTIFDIGCNDNKIIIIMEGIIRDFAMQSICASGTGNFLETISTKLGIPVEEFSKIALKSQSPATISGKCTVFAMSSCVSKLNSGCKKEDILMGVAKSLVRNYFGMLGRNKELKPPFVFTGGVSQNKVVVKCIEEELKTKVIVLEYSKVMGAIGAAILAKEYIESNGHKTKFKGFKISDFKYQTISRIGNCENQCEITDIWENNNRIGIFGNRCSKCETE